MDNILLQQACSNTVVFQSGSTTILTIAQTSPIDISNPATVFCYTVTQGANNPDLVYWLLGLCKNITADNIVNVNVTICSRSKFLAKVLKIFGKNNIRFLNQFRELMVYVFVNYFETTEERGGFLTPFNLSPAQSHFVTKLTHHNIDYILLFCIFVD